MKAIPISKFGGAPLEIEIADDYVRRVFPNAIYMTDLDNYTQVYMKTDKCIDDIEDGFHYCYYLINDVLYKSSLTSKHDELLRIYKLRQEQMSLF